MQGFLQRGWQSMMRDVVYG